MLSPLLKLPKPGPQSRALCGAVCASSIANSTFTHYSIVSLLILFNEFCGFFVFYYMTIIFALMILLATLLLTTITILMTL